MENFSVTDNFPRYSIEKPLEANIFKVFFMENLN